MSTDDRPTMALYGTEQADKRKAEARKYPLAERFKAPQGEGQFTGTQLAFMRMVGCSVGQKVCTACDTDFDRMRPDLGGGLYTPAELLDWAQPCTRVCLTGGEPLDRDLRGLLLECVERDVVPHVETSGTKHPDWLDPGIGMHQPGTHAIGVEVEGGRLAWRWVPMWVSVSPKPGFREEMVLAVADEVKVILGGLGDGPGWPTLEKAVEWADKGKLVYVQPRNLRNDIDDDAMTEALEVVAQFPQLRLSVQMHKYLRTR